jgi:hypothetical protein
MPGEVLGEEPLTAGKWYNPLDLCYGLKVASVLLCWNLKLQCNSIEKWGLQEAVS